MDLEFKTRKNVLMCSILLEESLSQLFLFIFRLSGKTYENKTLGNTSSSISLNTKIYLLSDFGYISDEERKKFIKFSEIRNQFIHNYYCDDFENLNDLQDKSVYSYLLKYSPNKSLKENFDLLFKDITEIVYKIDKEIREHALKEMNNVITQDVLSKIWDIMEESKVEYFIKNNIDASKVFLPWGPESYINGYIIELGNKIENQYKISKKELFVDSDKGVEFLLRMKKPK